MPTRLKRPSFWRQLFAAAGLVAFQGYLGFSVVSGQFGIQSQGQIRADIEKLKAQSAALQAEIDSYRHRVALFAPTKLDPDIVSERARALLSMAQPDDIVVMVDPATGKPISGSSEELTAMQLGDVINDNIDR